jgi:hypothetical protein
LDRCRNCQIDLRFGRKGKPASNSPVRWIEDISETLRVPCMASAIDVMVNIWGTVG